MNTDGGRDDGACDVGALDDIVVEDNDQFPCKVPQGRFQVQLQFRRRSPEGSRLSRDRAKVPPTSKYSKMAAAQTSSLLPHLLAKLI